MMRFLKSLGYFTLLAAAFSCIHGCGGTASSKTAPSVESQPSAQIPDNSAPKKSNSGYPPIASTVANAEIKSLDGTTFKVADKKGKVLLLNLWATWCGPCRAEMPALVRMQERHGDQLEIIGLNTDDEPVDQINEFAKKLNLNYHLAWAETSLQSNLLKISKYPGIPQSFLIDRDGNLRGVFRGANPVDVKKMEVVVAKVVQGIDDAPEPETAETPATAESPSTADSMPINGSSSDKQIKKGPKPE